MKKITLLLILSLSFSNWSFSQCTNQTYQWPADTVTISNGPGAQTIATNNWPQNEFSVVDGLVIGESYTVTIANLYYVTVTEDDRTTVIAHGVGSVSFVATTTEITCFWTADALCTNGPNTNTLTQIECTTCTCEVTAPLAAMTPDPANAATGVDIIYDEADTLIRFDWEDNAGGGPGSSYTFYLGTTITGDDIGNLSIANSTVLLNYTWAENTTYYWKVDTNNCAGTATSPVWSFTTSQCAALSAPPAVPSTQSPADAAVDVDIDESDPENLSITLDWNEAAVGDAATNYIISLGANMAGDDIGVVSTLDGDSTIDITYVWEYDTTYYWFVTAQNCAGISTPSAVFSFTTQSDPLSVEDFENRMIKHFYNSNENTLTITSENSNLDNISVFNLLGQQVVESRVNDQNNESIVNMSTLGNGIYIIQVSTTDNRTETFKVVKH